MWRHEQILSFFDDEDIRGTLDIMYELVQSKIMSRKLIGLAATMGVLAAGLGTVSPATAATGDVTTFPLPFANSQPSGIALDSIGNFWIGLSKVDQIVKATPTGGLVTIAIPNANKLAGTNSLALGTGNRMWLTEETANRVSYFNTLTNAYKGFDIPTKDSQPMGIAAGPDGAMWFTEYIGNKIGRVTNEGKFTEFNLGMNSGPVSIVLGPDGAMWFVAGDGNYIGRITTSGVITKFELPTANSIPSDLAFDKDGNLWFTQLGGNRIGRMTLKGLFAEFSLSKVNGHAIQIIQGPDGAMWFTQMEANGIGRITSGGIVTEYLLPGPNNGPYGIVVGTDGNIWSTAFESNLLVRFLTGIVPQEATGAPTLTATSTSSGATVTTTTGNWLRLPTSYSYQWQLCDANNDASCTTIAGATKETYVLTDAEAGKFIRSTVNATNLNGVSTAISQSARLAIDGLPPKLIPTPVVGGKTVQLVAGVTATLRASQKVKKGKRGRFTVTMSDRAVKGTVRISIVNRYSGRVLCLIASGKQININGNGQARTSSKNLKCGTGSHRLKAVYTPSADQLTTYPVATMIKNIRVTKKLKGNKR